MKKSGRFGKQLGLQAAHSFFLKSDWRSETSSAATLKPPTVEFGLQLLPLGRTGGLANIAGGVRVSRAATGRLILVFHDFQHKRCSTRSCWCATLAAPRAARSFPSPVCVLNPSLAVLDRRSNAGVVARMRWCVKKGAFHGLFGERVTHTGTCCFNPGIWGTSPHSFCYTTSKKCKFVAAEGLVLPLAAPTYGAQIEQNRSSNEPHPHRHTHASTKHSEWHCAPLSLCGGSDAPEACVLSGRIKK